MLPFNAKRYGDLGPEAKIQDSIIRELRAHEWFVKVIIGNALQHGMPDLFAAHLNFGPKWIEVKYRPHLSFTRRQQQTMPQMIAAGVGIWVLFDSTPEELMKLTKPCNFPQVYLNWSNGVR